MAIDDTKEEREARAARLRKQIEDMKKGIPLESDKIKNPRDFIHEKMREEEQENNEESDPEDENEQSGDCKK